MVTALILVFVLGYAAIALEHPIKINKTASALLTAVIAWTLLVMLPMPTGIENTSAFAAYLSGLGQAGLGSLQEHFSHFVGHELSHHLGSISEILFFLLGAMTIVELVDAHQGFRIITDRITTKNTVKLLWIVSIITFFLSSVLDNLTTSIVMVSLLRKLIQEAEQRKFFAGMVIIAANAGGAWTPIGDVTTTMLWIGGQISTGAIMSSVFLPSLVCLIVPLGVLSFSLRGEIKGFDQDPNQQDQGTVKGSLLMLILGVGSLLFVPVYKTVTHHPPYLGILLGLGLLWLVSELIHADKDEEERKPYTAVHALSKVDTSSVLFFLGILLAISALQTANILSAAATWLDQTVGDLRIIVYLIGMLSAVIDNVPLVAASQGMYDMATYPMDHWMWEFMAYCAGVGGSGLIIGSAAGVAVMGMEKIDFGWYLRKISLWAILGYTAGALVYLLMNGNLF
ncbi:MAG: sodium:proton antiporter NhaD [Bacteroidetes bacterium]|nr:sodium:proton antiporter NhaD [Bacteroidota bacterium]